MERWGDKRYYSLDYYVKQTFQEKLYKIALDGGMTCPNRDGTLGNTGCIFCSAGGSGDFAGDRNVSIKEQISDGKSLVQRKHTGSSYIAYFRHIRIPMPPSPTWNRFLWRQFRNRM